MKMIQMMTSIFMIVTMMLMLFSTMSQKTLLKWEKKNSFECGFNLNANKKPAFSSNFFLITILFLVFDIEISIIIPIIFMNNMNYINTTMSIIILISLTMALMMEWYQNMLEWSN